MNTETHFVVFNAANEITSVCATARGAKIIAKTQGNTWRKATVAFANGDWHLAEEEFALQQKLEERRAERDCGR